MRRLRFTLAHLMAIVLYLGLVFAALRNADALWASAVYTLAILMIATAIVGAFARKGQARTTWVGYAVFSVTYLIVIQLPPWGAGGLGFGPIPKPDLLIEWGTAVLQPYIYPTAPGGRNLTPYEQVSYSLGIILFGLIGAALGRILAAKDDRPNP